MTYYSIATATLILLLVSPIAVTAQQTEIGFKGGLNLYSLHLEHDIRTDNKAGLQYGFITRLYPDRIRPLSLQSEIIYSPQGVRLTTGDAMITLDHVNVPILLQYRFENGIQAQAGPQIGFLMNAKADRDGAALDIKNRFRKMDLSLSAGLSYILIPNSVGIDIRYNLGLSKISTDSFFRSKNRGFQIGIFYQFKYNDQDRR